MQYAAKQHCLAEIARMCLTRKPPNSAGNNLGNDNDNEPTSWLPTDTPNPRFRHSDLRRIIDAREVREEDVR